MFDLFDLESSLGGRVKSVLILVLITVILTYQGETQNRGEQVVDSVSVLTELQNPIDNYFNNIKIDDTYEDQIFYATVYLECWEQELLNGYDILESKAYPELSYPEEYVDASREYFLEFAESQSWMETYYEHGDSFFNGEPVSIQQLYNKAQIIRIQVLTIYNMLGDASGFIFNVSDYFSLD